VAVTVRAVHAVEILDSRGRPTLAVTVAADTGEVARAGVPSGASTGKREAIELRDREIDRFFGLGVQRAVGNVNDEIAEALCGATFGSLEELDGVLIELDGTPTKERLGANAIVGVSLASSRLFSMVSGEELWRSLSFGGHPPRLPVPHFNVVNGGAHASNNLDFQEFMLAPLGAPNLASAMRAGAEIYATLRALLFDRGLATGLGDEGGFAPDIDSPRLVLELLVKAIVEAGYEPSSTGVAIALDPAANGFFKDGRYIVGRQSLSTHEMINLYEEMLSAFPICSIEDGLAEDDISGWIEMTSRLGDRIQLVGDDLFVTSPTIISEAIDSHTANAALIKVNQVGTVTETLRAIGVCRAGGYAQMISHRSGETEDSFIADLAQIKSGAPARGERVSKYNRLLEIEAKTELPFGLDDA
jgi:enolase